MQRKLLGWLKRTRDSCAPLVCYPFCSSIGSEENPSIQQRWAEGFWQFLGMVSMAVWIQIVGEPLFFSAGGANPVCRMAKKSLYLYRGYSRCFKDRNDERFEE